MAKGEKCGVAEVVASNHAPSRGRAPSSVAAVVIVAMTIFSPTLARAQEADADSSALETKNIFGFTSGTDIGPEFDREIELETNLAFGKRSGAYNVGDQKATLEYNPTAWLEVDTGLRGTFNQIKGVDGLDDRSGANFGGVE